MLLALVAVLLASLLFPCACDIADSGFVGLDAGRLRMARELEAPGRMNRAGLIAIAQAERLLNQLTGSIQNEPLASYAADQPVFFEGTSA